MAGDSDKEARATVDEREAEGSPARTGTWGSTATPVALHGNDSALESEHMAAGKDAGPEGSHVEKIPSDQNKTTLEVEQASKGKNGTNASIKSTRSVRSVLVQDAKDRVILAYRDRHNVLEAFNGFEEYVNTDKDLQCEACGEINSEWPLELYRTPYPPREVFHWEPEREGLLEAPTDAINDPPDVPADPDDCVAVDFVHDLSTSPGRKVARIKNYRIHQEPNFMNYLHRIPRLWRSKFAERPTLEALRLFFLASATVNGILQTPRLTSPQYEEVTIHFRLPIFWLARTLEDERFGTISKYVSEPDAQGLTYTSYVVTFNARNNPSGYPHLPLRCACGSEPTKNIQYVIIDGNPDATMDELGRRITDLSNHINHPLLTLLLCLELYLNDDLAGKAMVDRKLQRIESFTETGIPVYPRMQKKFILPETLKAYDLPWKFDKNDPRYVLVMQELSVPETDAMFEHSRGLLRERYPELNVKDDSSENEDPDDKRSRRSYETNTLRASEGNAARYAKLMLEKWDELDDEIGLNAPRPGRVGRTDTNISKRKWLTRRKESKPDQKEAELLPPVSVARDDLVPRQEGPPPPPLPRPSSGRRSFSGSESSMSGSWPRRKTNPYEETKKVNWVQNTHDPYYDARGMHKDAGSKRYTDQASRLSTLSINISVLQSSLDFSMKLAKFLEAENRPLLEKEFKWNSAQLIQSRIDNILRTVELLSANVRGFEKRATTQQSLLYSLISQTDSSIGIRIAQSSEGIAADSRRDSSAMKTLAVLTMLFLPGTAVASIFSMQFFNFPDTDDSIVKKQFWIYWVVTVPLTLLCIIFWDQWTKWRREDDEIARIKRSERSARDANDAIDMWLFMNRKKRSFIRRVLENIFGDREYDIAGVFPRRNSINSFGSIPVNKGNKMTRVFQNFAMWRRKDQRESSMDVEDMTRTSPMPPPIKRSFESHARKSNLRQRENAVQVPDSPGPFD